MTPQELLGELCALLEEHDSMVRGMTIPNVTSNVLFVDLIVRLAETLDAFFEANAVGAGLDRASDEIVVRAIDRVGRALLVADIVDGMARGSRTPSARALSRWFPAERVQALRAQAASVPSGEG